MTYAHGMPSTLQILLIDGTEIKRMSNLWKPKGDLKILYKDVLVAVLAAHSRFCKHNILVYDVGDIDFRDIINVDIEGHSYPMRLIEIQDWDVEFPGYQHCLTLVPTKGT